MINKNMKIAELLELNVGDEKINKIAETLFHGIDIDEMVEALNKVVNE